MNKVLTFLFVFAVSLAIASISKPAPLYFTENKGQIGDQNHKPRPDVLFGASDGQLTFHLKNNGIAYQQYRVDEWMEIPDFIDDKKTRKVSKLQTIYRTDVEWLNCNTNCIIEKEFAKQGSENYYNAICQNGVSGVMSFQQITYKNIYAGIDLKWYSENGHLKYDYYVAADVDHRVIKLKYEGATKLSLNEKGTLIITTALGEIVEQKPLVKQNGKILKSAWKIEGNTVSFTIEGRNNSLPMIIDPGIRIWGTYYGGTGGESTMNSAVDANGNVYTSGTTSSNNGNSIATVGSHQATYGGGQDNAFIAKFNASGVRQWATYYGGPTREFGISLALDNTGANVYLCGHSLSSVGNVIATPGAHQTTFGGFWDAFLVKFNSNGIRQWGTYYGDTGMEHGNGVGTDAAGNVYLCGKTDAATTNFIATAGCHQPGFGGVEDCFLVKFNSSGVRQWGTYYGGTGSDVARGIHVEANGDIFLTGWTDNSVPNVIASPGSHQNAYGGGSYDAFLTKFNTNGVRQWGTQYGGGGTDQAYDCAVDLLGNVYMSGKTQSTQSISTVGCHQLNYGGGGYDVFLASFTAAGVRNWGTYYGGSGDEESWGCSVHKSGHIFVTGLTSSNTGTIIATVSSHQPNHGGSTWDCFIAQFDPSTNGARTWGTYYGGSSDDVGYGCTSDNAYHVYLTGSAFSSTGNDIASAGSHQPLYGGGAFGDAFIAKFYDCPAPLAPTNTTVPANLSFCEGVTTTLSAISGATMSWYSTPTSTAVIGTGSVYVTPVLSAGNYTYYVDAATCTNSPRTPISVTVFALPNLNVVSFPTLVCAGKNSTLSVSGAASYTWDSSATTNTVLVTPSVTSIYTVTGTNTLGCTNSKTISVTVYPLDPVTFTPEKDTSCLHIFGGTPILLVGSPTGGVFSGANVSGTYLNPTALGVFNPVYTYTNPTNGCVNSATATILVVNCTSINEENAFVKNISIYPNPTKGHIVVETNSDMDKTITILDARGRIIRNETSKQRTLQYSIADEANGIYFIKISSSLGSKEFKLVKE
ncbi:MAG: SBBP repeat-containing protein [Bacteroidia bacterium]|nr:SBBP repeat-containing protein [Bacteroidia bacterium]